MNDSWLEIACDVPVEYADNVADFLTGITGNGVCVDNVCVDAFSVSEIPDSLRVVVKGYIAESEDSESLLQDISILIDELSCKHPDMCFGKPVLSVVTAEDWSSSWKVHFKPIRVGKRMLIVPTWEDSPVLPDELVIRIDPGMAFGTGGHETTRLCLELLEQVMDESSLLHVPSLLDLGTGSGILAMASALLGAGRILALDIDSEAILVAKDNIALNDLDDVIECGTIPLEVLSECFDIILANILAEELLRLAPDLVKRMNNGGWLILSGILTEKEALVRSCFDELPLTYTRTLHAGEWVAILYKRDSCA